MEDTQYKEKLEKMYDKNLNFLRCMILNHIREADILLCEYRQNLIEYKGQEEADRYFCNQLRTYMRFSEQLGRMMSKFA